MQCYITWPASRLLPLFSSPPRHKKDSLCLFYNYFHDVFFFLDNLSSFRCRLYGFMCSTRLVTMVLIFRLGVTVRSLLTVSSGTLHQLLNFLPTSKIEMQIYSLFKNHVPSLFTLPNKVYLFSYFFTVSNPCILVAMLSCLRWK